MFDNEPRDDRTGWERGGDDDVCEHACDVEGFCEKCGVATIPMADADVVISLLIDEDYEPGVPGRACVKCHSAWPASEPDDRPWHHEAGCKVAS